VSTNDKKLGDLNMQMTVMNQLEKYASSPASMGILPSTLGVNDQSLTTQMNTLSALQMKYEQLKGTVAENHPSLLAITSQINQIKPDILANIQSQRKNLEQGISSLNTTGGMYNNIISAIPQKERQLVEITRDQNIKNGIYSFLLQKREESELSLASSISDSRVVNFAQSSRAPVSPNRMMIYLMAAAIALGCPFAYITAREAFSPKILYRHEIEALTNIPIVGEIAFSKSKEALVVQPGKRTVIAEEFRKVRVSLLSLGIDAGHKKILITSSISGEGKSFIAANLATSISLTGKKVVLIDMDLHNPGLGKFFNIKETPGVSDYLIGKKDAGQIIYNIPGNENLFYISSGTLQQDSSELLENGKVRTLIAQLDTDFDIVIIDSAPIGLITDAYLLSSICDATLYVVMHKVTPKILIKRIDDNLEVNPIKNPGIIFNGVKIRGFLNSNYGYGHNYVYSYGKDKNKKSFT
jgi:tyrosine-protein kinase Etk/Wzc